MCNEWRPIDSAPKDGTVMLLFGAQRPHNMVFSRGNFIFTGYWDTLDDAWCASGSTWSGPFYDPIYWMPLPAAPSLTESEVKQYIETDNKGDQQ